MSPRRLMRSGIFRRQERWLELTSCSRDSYCGVAPCMAKTSVLFAGITPNELARFRNSIPHCEVYFHAARRERRNRAEVMARQQASLHFIRVALCTGRVAGSGESGAARGLALSRILPKVSLEKPRDDRNRRDGPDRERPHPEPFGPPAAEGPPPGALPTQAAASKEGEACHRPEASHLDVKGDQKLHGTCFRVASTETNFGEGTM